MRAALILLAVPAILVISCGGDDLQTEEPVPVTVIVPLPQVITATVVVPCRLEASSEAVVTPLNPGRIVDVFVTEGDTVETGDILVELSTDQQYSGAVAASAARLEAARAVAGNRRADLQRAERLRADGAVSETEYEMAVSSSASAEASVREAWAGYESARSMSESGRIQAPFGGVVTRVWAREGFISSGPLVSITDSGVLTAELLVAERHLPFLSEGLPVVFTTSHYPDVLFSGKVSSFSTSVDPVSGLVPVRVQFPDDSGSLRSGMTGTATLARETSEDAVVLPVRTLLRGDGGEWMAVLLEDGEARIVTVEAGIMSGSVLEIISGVEPGDSVIDMGHHLVEEGSAVRVVER
jgi:RND family efflux transporter MFP subunit